MFRKTVLVILHLQAMFPQCSRNNLSVRATDKLLNFFFFRSCIIVPQVNQRINPFWCPSGGAVK